MISYIVNVLLLFKLMPILSQYTKNNLHLTILYFSGNLLQFEQTICFKNALRDALNCYLYKICQQRHN